MALVGHTVAKELFGIPGFAYGETIRVNKVPLKVIGILAAKGQDMRGMDQDDTIIIPITTANRRVIGTTNTNANRVSRLTVNVASAEELDYAAEEIESLLNQRHRVAAGQPSPFMVMNLTAMLSTRAEANAVFSMLLAGVAGVSLLVGGIGAVSYTHLTLPTKRIV